MSKIRTRFAPSPTGYMQVGNLRTALLNYVMSKSNNGEFILRIDDTDQERNKPDYIDFIYDQMNYFGLSFDLTFKQSDRLSRYIEVSKILIDNNVAVKLDDNSIIVNMGQYDMCIIRSNGFPTYNFASILDDYDYDITHIIRGVDHIQNEDKQLKLWEFFSTFLKFKDFPKIIHAGLLFDKGSKLSKRSGKGLTSDYVNYLPISVLNWLFKMGWSHPDPNFDKKYKILTMDNMISLFNDGNISNRNCNIDINKLNFIDKIQRKVIQEV